jgi:two-component system nitrate/nitrite response regulator NarL
MEDQLLAAAENGSEWDSAEVEALVRRLVAHLDGGLSPSADQGAVWSGPVILDVEVDGVRCRLIRASRTSSLLSPREREIALMVARGYPNRTIASALDISSWTVASHLRRVFSKLGVSSRAAMVARLLEEERADSHHPDRDLPDARGSHLG